MAFRSVVDESGGTKQLPTSPFMSEAWAQKRHKNVSRATTRFGRFLRRIEGQQTTENQASVSEQRLFHQQHKREIGPTDDLNALFPPTKEDLEFERALAKVNNEKFEEILRKIAPGNPYAERLLSAAKKN
jgi:hypothetical protein